MIVLLFGPPGVGKGTQADLLTKYYKLTVCSTGNMLRDEIVRNSDLGKIVKGYLEQGELVPDHHLCTLVEQFLRKHKNNSMLFDGFPRSIKQAQIFDTLLASVDLKLDIALELHLAEDEIVSRLKHRRYCSECGRTYNLLTNQPAENDRCDSCGATLAQRSDDTEEVIRRRMNVYIQETQPLIAYYQNKSIYHQVSAQGSQQQIFDRIAHIFNGHID